VDVVIAVFIMSVIWVRSKGNNNLRNFGLMPSRPSEFDFTLSQQPRTSHCLTHIKVNLLSYSGKALSYLLHVASGTSNCTDFLFRSLTSTWCGASCLILPIPCFLKKKFSFYIASTYCRMRHESLYLYTLAEGILISVRSLQRSEGTFPTP